MVLHYLTFKKVKDILRTFQPENHKKLRTSQPEKKFAGPYKKKEVYAKSLTDKQEFKEITIDSDDEPPPAESP